MAIAGYTVVALGFGGFMAWAAFAHLDSAVTAHASVSLESRRQVVQHLEGGIIREILVREGDKVEMRQLLYRLDDTQTRANLDLIHNQLYAALALEAWTASSDGTILKSRRRKTRSTRSSCR